jgi:hypothetical protein
MLEFVAIIKAMQRIGRYAEQAKRMQYTIENLKTQLTNKIQALEHEKRLRTHTMSADFQPAKDYGEEVRVNHLRTINDRIGYIERQILELKCQIADRS